MKRIQLLDTSIGTSNIGDSIIMECVRKELMPILKDSFVYNMPTHLPAFNAFSVWRNSSVVQMYSNCDYKFAGGSNLLVKDLKTHYPQWNINKWNSKPLNGVITVGVGAGAGDYTNSYTTKLYRSVLNHEYYHSVRDERSKEYVEKILGLKAINTGCVTMWMLTPEFCKTIPTKKADTALITLTARTELNPNEQDIEEQAEVISESLNQEDVAVGRRGNLCDITVTGIDGNATYVYMKMKGCTYDMRKNEDASYSVTIDSKNYWNDVEFITYQAGKITKYSLVQ